VAETVEDAAGPEGCGKKGPARGEAGGRVGQPGAVIPVGIITAVAGVPMLFTIIARRGSEG